MDGSSEGWDDFFASLGAELQGIHEMDASSACTNLKHARIVASAVSQQLGAQEHLAGIDRDVQKPPGVSSVDLDHAIPASSEETRLRVHASQLEQWQVSEPADAKCSSSDAQAAEQPVGNSKQLARAAAAQRDPVDAAENGSECERVVTLVMEPRKAQHAASSGAPPRLGTYLGNALHADEIGVGNHAPPPSIGRTGKTSHAREDSGADADGVSVALAGSLQKGLVGVGELGELGVLAAVCTGPASQKQHEALAEEREHSAGDLSFPLSAIEGPVPLSCLDDEGDSAGRHGGDALDHILGAAVASSARRCEGAWPARGRPDPVRQQCMLGGQLSLEVASQPVHGGAPQLLTASCSAPVGWDQSRNQGLGAVASCNIVAAGYANGSTELIFDSGRGVQVLPLPSRDKSAGAVTCLCFHAPLPGCPMWLLAAAYAGAEGRVRVFDLTGALARLAACTDMQLKPSDAAAVMSGVAERTRSVGFEVVLLFRHSVRKTAATGASLMAGCQLFVAAGAAPIGLSPDTMQLRAVACRTSPLKMLMSVTLHEHAVLHEPVSVYTGRFEPSESCDVVGTRMNGAWRSVASMPFLRSALEPDSTPCVEPLAAFASPKATAWRSRQAPDAAGDVLQELLAVVAMDDVHICRLVSRDNKAHSSVLRLSRLFSLGVGKGAWGGLGCAAWAPRAEEGRYQFPRLRAASSSLPPPTGDAPVLPAAFLATAWNHSVHVFAVPPRVSASPPDAEAKLYLQPQQVVAFSLAADEVVAQLLWLRTVTGTLKLAVVAIPARPDEGAGSRGDGAIILPTLYLFDVRTGAREEVLELSAVMPEAPPQSPLAQALAQMTPAAATTLDSHAHSVATDLNAGRVGTEAVYSAVRGEALAVADVAVPAGFHMLADDKIVAALPALAGPAPQLLLHFASHLSWRAQADVLEAIAVDARDSALTRWEMCLQHSCRHWLRLRAAAAREPGAAGEAAAVQQRVSIQLVAMMDFLEPLALQAAHDMQQPPPSLADGGPLISWHPPSAQDMVRPGVLQLAAFASLATLLVACGQEAVAGAIGGPDCLYRRLRAMGFRPACVLAARRVLRAGLQPHLPPDFIDDAVAVVLGAAGVPPSSPGGKDSLARRRAALQEMFLCMHDTAATDINRLVAACRDSHLWEGLIHAAHLIRQPLLPAHDMLSAAAAAFSATPAHIPDSGIYLLRYAASCLLQGPHRSGHLQQAEHTAQMCMLAFLLWTTVDYYRQVAPPGVSDLLPGPYPVLQLLLRVDVNATVAMFEDLPLLAEGSYCGTDDIAAAIAPLGLSELHCLAPRPVLSLRQAVVNAFAELVSLHGDSAAPTVGSCTDSSAASDAARAASRAANALDAPLDVTGPLRLVCGQVGRSPPAVLAPPVASACILQLCAGGLAMQAMVEAVASAVTLELPEGPHASPTGGALAPALQALESTRMWGPAALLHGRLGDLAGETRCALLRCQEVLQLCSEVLADPTEADPTTGAPAETAHESGVMARLSDLVGGDLAAGAGPRAGAREAVAHAAAVLLQRLLARLGGQLQAAAPRAHGARVLQSCAVELCQAEARCQRLAGEHGGHLRAAGLLLEHLAFEDVKAVALSSEWQTGGDLAGQLSVLRSITATTPPGLRAAGPVTSAARAVQALSQDSEVQRELLARCCEFDPDEVVPYLRGLRVAAPPWAMEVVRKHGSLDGLAFLHHSAGEPAAAAHCAMQHLAQCLRGFRAWVEDVALPTVADLHCADQSHEAASHCDSGVLTAWRDLVASVLSPAKEVNLQAAAGTRCRREIVPKAIRTTGTRRVAGVRAALVTAQRYAAASAPAEAGQPERDVALPSPGTWETLFLLLLAELADAQMQVQQPASDAHKDPLQAPGGTAFMHLFFQLWAAHVVPLLDSAIKACIEHGQHSCLCTTLSTLGWIASMDDVSKFRRGEEGAPEPCGGWEYLGSLVAADESCVHEVAAGFGKLCLSAHKTALYLKKSQMQVMASDVVQLQGECLRLMHQSALVAIEP